MLETPQEVTIGRAPDQYRPIFSGAAQKPAIGGPLHRRDQSVLLNAYPAGAFRNIPEADATIKTAAGKPTAIRTPVHTEYRTGMTLQDMGADTRLGIPEAQGAIMAAASDAVCGTTPCHGL